MSKMLLVINFYENGSRGKWNGIIVNLNDEYIGFEDIVFMVMLKIEVFVLEGLKI